MISYTFIPGVVAGDVVAGPAGMGADPTSVVAGPAGMGADPAGVGDVGMLH